MADGEMYNWMRSMQACHEKHIGGPPPLHRRIAYAEAHSEPPRARASVLRRLAAWGGRLLGRAPEGGE